MGVVPAFWLAHATNPIRTVPCHPVRMPSITGSATWRNVKVSLDTRVPSSPSPLPAQCSASKRPPPRLRSSSASPFSARSPSPLPSCAARPHRYFCLAPRQLQSAVAPARAQPVTKLRRSWTAHSYPEQRERVWHPTSPSTGRAAHHTRAARTAPRATPTPTRPPRQRALFTYNKNIPASWRGGG